MRPDTIQKIKAEGLRIQEQGPVQNRHSVSQGRFVYDAFRSVEQLNHTKAGSPNYSSCLPTARI
jgi:hypothetical protein